MTKEGLFGFLKVSQALEMVLKFGLGLGVTLGSTIFLGPVIRFGLGSGLEFGLGLGFGFRFELGVGM